MSCQIRYDKHGNVSRVNAPNGNESLLYQTLKNTLGNSNDALKAWARVYTDNFKQWFGDWEGNPIKKGVKELFSSNKELSNIGTEEQYSQYLDTIFPDSVYKDVLVHYSDKTIGSFKYTTDFGFHFADPSEIDDEFLNQLSNYKEVDKSELKPIYVKLDSNALEIANQRTWNPISIVEDMYKRGYIDTIEAKNMIINKINGSSNKFDILKKILKSFNITGFYYFNENEGGYAYTVFEPEQIHILGSKQDIEGFKDFVKAHKKVSPEVLDENGEPRIFWHKGEVNGEFDAALSSPFNTYGQGNYFAYTADVANVEGKPGTPSAEGYFLRVEKPLVVKPTSNPEESHEQWKNVMRKVFKRNTTRSFDAVIDRNREVVVYDANQVKSISNNGDFSRNKNNTHELRDAQNQRVGRVLMDHILHALAKAIKLDYEVVDFNTDGRTSQYRNNMGLYLNGKVLINKNKLSAETPVHEFAHAFLKVIQQKNKVLYNNLLEQIKTSDVLTEVKAMYPDLSTEDQLDEAIVTAIGRYGAGLVSSLPTMLVKAIKRFFVSLGKLVGIDTSVEVGGLDPNTTMFELASMMFNGRQLFDLDSDLTGSHELRFWNNGVEVTQEAAIATDDETYQMRAPNGSVSILKRVTPLIEAIFNPFANKEGGYERYLAKKEFKKQHQNVNGGKVSLGNGLMTFEEAQEYFKSTSEISRIKGKVIHKIFEKYFTDPSNPKYSQLDGELAALKAEYAKYDDSPFTFQWLNSNKLEEIRDYLGITSDDTVYTEFTVLDPETGLGGTIDLLIKHKDGSYSIYDFKTGSLSEGDNPAFMNFGERFGAHWSLADKHKLQQTFYMLMLKNKYPNIRFRDVGIIKPSQYDIEIMRVERDKYLGTLQEYFRGSNPSLLEKKPYLFKHQEYTALSRSLSADLDSVMKEGGVKNVFEARDILLLRLKKALEKIRKSGIGGKMPLTDTYVQNNMRVRETEESLILKIAQLEGNEFGDYLSGMGTDMGFTERLTSVGYNVKNPLLKMFNKMYEEAKNLMTKERHDLYKKSDELVNKLLKAYYGENQGRMLIDKLTRGAFNFINYEEVFKFMWKGDDISGRKILTEYDPGFKDLTADQREYNIFYRDGIRDTMFAAMSTRRGINYYQAKLDNLSKDELLKYYSRDELKAKYESKIAYFKSLPETEKWIDELGSGREYEEDMTPYIPKLPPELKGFREKTGQIKDWFWSNLVYTDFKAKNKDLFGLKPVGVPVKYLVSPFSYGAKGHSLHTEATFKMFVQNMKAKQHYDDLAVYGQAIHDVLAYGTKSSSVEENSAVWIKNFVNNNIAEIYNDKRLGMGTEFKVGNRKVQLGKLTYAVMGLATAAKLSWSTLGAASNAVLNYLYVTKEAVKGSIAKDLVGIDPEDIDWTVSDLAKAHGIYFQHLYNKNILGKKDKWEELNQIYDFTQRQFNYNKTKENLTVASNRLLDAKWAYLTYGIGDDIGYSITTIATLMRKKNSKTGVSMWDSYSFENGELKWTGGMRGRTETGDVIEGLSAQEIFSIKKANSRIMGEYDKSRKREMEGNALLSVFLQFHKYLPNVLERGWQGWKGDFENASLGKLVEVLDNETGKTLTDVDGNPLLRWESRLDKGSMLLASKVIGDAPGIRHMKLMVRALYAGEAIKMDAMRGGTEWKKLSAEQKQNVISLLLSWALWVGITGAMVAVYGDDDDDPRDPLKRRLSNLKSDLTAEGNALELLRFLNKPTVLLPTLLEVTEGANNVLFKGIIQGKRMRNGDMPGSKNLIKNIPFAGNSYMQNVADPWWDQGSGNQGRAR